MFIIDKLVSVIVWGEPHNKKSPNQSITKFDNTVLGAQSYQEIMTWKRVVQYWPFVREYPASNVELWLFVVSLTSY